MLDTLDIMFVVHPEIVLGSLRRSMLLFQIFEVGACPFHFYAGLLEQLIIERSSPLFPSGVRFRGRQEDGLSIVMKESRPRLLQRCCTRLRIKHNDVLGLSGVCSLHFLFGQKSTHWLVLCARTAIFNCRKRSWRGVKHALGVCGRLCFVENVFGWGERPYLGMSAGNGVWERRGTYLHDSPVRAAGHDHTLLFFKCYAPYCVRRSCQFSDQLPSLQIPDFNSAIASSAYYPRVIEL